MNKVELLSSLINSECEECDYNEQLLIGSVVLNRMQERKKTMEEIIYADKQFHGICNKRFFPTSKTLKVAAELLIAGSVDTTIHYFWLIKSKNKPWRNKIKIKIKSKYHVFGNIYMPM